MYYHACVEVNLERQVGSRYFVSSANAAKAFFLSKAAVMFLKYTEKDMGNNLERCLYQKLQDPAELAHLKADGIMFYLVYAELVMLVKSDKFDLSVIDMNKHYRELQVFLQITKEDPQFAMNKDHRVFVSEEQLYGSDKAINHRIREKNKEVYARLFKSDDWDNSILSPLLAAGAAKMEEKLSNYAKNYLPGGKYWQPDPAITRILRDLKPNNDICESILGLNDYLTTAVPNMHQMTRTNLVEVKKNKTVQWYKDLSHKERDAVTNLAMTRRKSVMKQYCEEERERSEQRQKNMKRSHQYKKAMREKAAKERDQLSRQHLVTSSGELMNALAEIDASKASTTSKKREKVAFLRTQINIRKKVLDQKIRIPFTQHGKNRPFTTIVKEFTEFITAHSQIVVPSSGVQGISQNDAYSFVGKSILHKFILESGKEKWFSGVVVNYNSITRTFEIAYDEEEEHQYFDLTEDILDGDLKFIEPHSL